MPERLQAEIEHPLRFALHARNILDDLAIQTLFGFECVVIITVMKTVFVFANIFKIFASSLIS
jgi:hypothetical protein